MSCPKSQGRSMGGQMLEPKLVLSLLGLPPDCGFDAEPLNFGLYPICFERTRTVALGQRNLHQCYKMLCQPKVLAC